MVAEPGYEAATISLDRKPSHDLVLSSNGEYIISPPKYISNLSNGTDTYVIKDAEARTAIANKQDILVSGTNIKTINNTSILGSGNISISTGDYDNETITKNGDNELQTVAIANPNTNSGAISPLKIWNGTEQQWNQGEVATTWYNWQSSNVSVLGSGSLPNSGWWIKAAYGNNTYITLLSNNNITAYSTDGGITWSRGGSSLFTHQWFTLCYGNGKFVALGIGSLNGAYTEDNGLTWNSITLPFSYSWYDITYGNGKFVALGYNSSNLINKCIYSEDGINWSEATLPGALYWKAVTYGNNKFIAIAMNTNKYAYSEDGINWSEGTFPTTASWYDITYGNGKFVVIIYSSDTAYYSEDGINWTSSSMPSNTNWSSVDCLDEKFIAVSTKTYAYSVDGVNWKAGTSSSTSGNRAITAGSDNFLLFTSSNTNTPFSRLSFTSLSCFTLDATPTTSSTVYNAPEETSALTITSVGSDTITLSDTHTYDCTPSGNQSTYRTIGAVHPDWLCNINNVGVKIGNTTIATDGSDLLPSQTGNSGKFLTTNGTTTSWGTVTQPSIATTSTAGLVKPDGTTITITNDGTISASAGAYAMVIVDYTEEE